MQQACNMRFLGQDTQMAKTGSASATIGLDYSAFEQGGKAVLEISLKMSNFLKNTLAVAAGTVIGSAFTAAAGAIKSFVGSIRSSLADIFSQGEAMANMAHATGMATDAYMKFRLAGEKGISVTEAGELLGRNAEIMRKDASIFRDISLKLYAVGERIQGFWLGVADKIAPVLNPLLDRLTALDLSTWGQAFAKPIADAVAIIYQLALDGQLWKTMGELAAAAFKYAGEVLGKLVSLFASEGFSIALKSLVAQLSPIGSWMGDFFAAALSNAFNIAGRILVAYGNSFFNLIDRAMVALGVTTEEHAADNAAERAQNANAAFGPLNLPTAPTITGVADFGKALKDAFTSVQFGNEELNSKLADALSKFEAKAKDATAFSNRTAVQNFGVSSLAAVGGGGGVGRGGLLDEAARQTRLQESMAADLKIIASKTPQPQPGTLPYNFPRAPDILIK